MCWPDGVEDRLTYYCDERLAAPLNAEALRSGGQAVPYVLPYFGA